jgi:hypothetical protein
VFGQSTLAFARAQGKLYSILVLDLLPCGCWNSLGADSRSADG